MSADGMKQNDQRAAGQSFSVRRLIPVIILVAGLFAVYGLGLNEYFGFEALGDNRDDLVAWVARDRPVAAVVFIMIYALVVALSLPGGAFLTIVGGFLFGTYWGTLCALIGAVVGATAVFVAARTAFRDLLRARAGPFLTKMEAGFRANAFSYLIALRLVPLFPFWLVNLVPAFLGVPLRTYVLGTALGIIPGTFVYASFGNGLGALIDMGTTPDPSVIFGPAILTPIIGLALLALAPVAYKWLKARRSRMSG
jgi:uncharacterized membrane protein YdjX (TVP38/TMEM64 family)